MTLALCLLAATVATAAPTPLPIPAAATAKIDAQRRALNVAEANLALMQEHRNAEAATLQVLIEHTALELHLDLETHTTALEGKVGGPYSFSVKKPDPMPAPDKAEAEQPVQPEKE